MAKTKQNNSFLPPERAPLGLKVIGAILVLAALSLYFMPLAQADSDPLNLGSRFTGRSGGASSGGGGGSGDVNGPASSTDECVARFDGTGGKTLQDSASGLCVTDAGAVTSGSWTSSPIGIAYGGTGINFTDPNADRILFWDDSAGAFAGLTAGSGLTITGTTLTASGGGSGDVVGPASATDNALARFDATTGKLLQNSGAILDDSNNLSGIGTIATGAATITGATTITSNSANSLAVGPNGTTNPVLKITSSTASQSSGIDINGGNGTTSITAISSAAASSLALVSKGAANITLNSGNFIQLQASGNDKVLIGSSQTTITNGGSNTAATTPILISPTGGTSMTAGTEALSLILGSGSKTWASNTGIASQRFVVVSQPTAAFASATGTITNAYTMAISGQPLAGTNAIITNPYALGILSGNSYYAGKHVFDSTITPGATTGDQTINKPTGTVNIAAAGTTVTVTNSLVTTSSIVMAVLRTNDSTAAIKNVVPGAGSFVINLTAAATAEVSIGFMVIN